MYICDFNKVRNKNDCLCDEAFPAGNALWFCQIFLFCLFFRRQGFRTITFDRQAGPFQNFGRSRVMVIGRSVSFSDSARPPVGAWGAPNTPNPPPKKKYFFCVRFRTPGTFLKKIICREKNFFCLPPPPHIFFAFFCEQKKFS